MTRYHQKLITSAARIACIPLALASMAWLVPSFTTLALARQSSPVLFKPRPGQGAPSQTAGGGTRGNCPTAIATKAMASEGVDPLALLTLMVPGTDRARIVTPDEKEIVPVQLTASEHPAFLVYVPPTLVQQAELTIQSDVREGDVISRNVKPDTHVLLVDLDPATAATGGIIKVELPSEQPGLQVSETYRWEFALVCNRLDRQQDVVVKGKVQRVALDPSLQANLELATSSVEQAALYGEAGIWFDMLAALADMKHDRQSDDTVLQTWEALLNSDTVQLKPFVEASLH